MKEENVNIYRCEYCNKYYLRKHHAKYHEKWCSKNPKMLIKCANCRHLVSREKVVFFDYEYNEYEKKYIIPYCLKKGQYMYHPRIERLSAYKVYGLEIHQIKMPLSCDMFEN